MPEKNDTFLQYTWPAFSWAALILILCGIPGTTIPKLSFLEWLRPDKVAHLILFGMQCFLLIRGFSKQKDFQFLKKNAVVIALILSIAYGGIVELMQVYIFTQRSGDIRDALANSLGAFMGYWFYKWNVRRSAKVMSN